jgi:hypothetical protein
MTGVQMASQIGHLVALGWHKDALKARIGQARICGKGGSKGAGRPFLPRRSR